MELTLTLAGRKFQLGAKYSYRYLVFSMVALLLVYPFVEQHSLAQIILNVILLFSLLTGAMSAATSQRQFQLSVLFAVLILLYPQRWLAFASSLVGLLFFVYVASVISRDLFTRGKTVTTDTIFGAVGVYLLIGVAWTFGYIALELAVPGSYNIEIALTAGADLNFDKFIYYSFVTLTTLGYGDVTPLLPPARALAYMEAIVGQVYLTVLVARLVGMHIAGRA